ncbi:thermonuclease family protein [Candidatus Woesebacteria bacterium]|nr:thermonuclease family protein [Candidatus Woesebacteria bacterium]
MLKFLVIISAIIVSGTFTIRVITHSQQSVHSSSLPTATTSFGILEKSIKGIQTSITPTPSNNYSLEIAVVPAIVKEVLAPDMLTVEVNGKSVLVHLIGLEIPTDEQLRRYFNHHEEKILDTVKKMLEKTTVFLVTTGDTEEIEVEPLERYVFQSDMSFLNTRLIAEGLAIYQSENREYVRYSQEFTNTQLQAQIQHKGIWLEISPTFTPGPTHFVQTTKARQTPQPTQQKKDLNPTSIPTQTVTPVTITPQTSSIPTQSTVTPPVRSLSGEKLLVLINEHRKGLQLPALEKNEYLCNIANTRAPQLYDEIFTNHNVHAGFYAMNLPYWITENMAHYESEEKIMQWWLNSTVHRHAIEGNHTYSCGACFGNSCAQLFTSLVKK